MIKRVSLVNRKPGIPVEEFQRYWREVHAPLALAVPGLRGYVQSHTMLETYDAPEPPTYDGIVETWWDSVEASEEARLTPQRALVDADHPNFIGASAGVITTEVVLREGFANAADRQSLLKSIAIIHKRAGVSVESFQEHWRERHGPVFAARPSARRYVQSQVLPETYVGPVAPACDGIAATWFDSLAVYRNREGEAGLDPLWPNYRERVERIFTREIALS